MTSRSFYVFSTISLTWSPNLFAGYNFKADIDVFLHQTSFGLKLCGETLIISIVEYNLILKIILFCEVIRRKC